MFITHDMWGSVKPFVRLAYFVSKPLLVKSSNQNEDKKVAKDKSQFSILPVCPPPSELMYIFIYIPAHSALSPLSPLSHTARIDQYLIFSQRRWEVEVCDCWWSSAFPFCYILCSSSVLLFPPLSLSLLVSSLSLTAASDLGHRSSVSDSLFGPGSLLSFSNVMSHH